MKDQQIEIRIPAYKVTVNKAAFLCKKSYLKQKLSKEYTPLYWKKFNMDQKKIVPNGQDRLCMLTTNQIDRIIDNQKIQTLIHNNKQKIQPIWFDKQAALANKHSKIYQANYLAKINQIAIKKDINFISLEGMVDDNVKIDKTTKIDEKRKPFKYAKQYRKMKGMLKKTAQAQSEYEDDKSIQSFQNNLQEFQERLAEMKRCKIMDKQKVGGSKIRKNFKLIPENRWFYGMSMIFIKGKSQEKQKDSCRQSWKHSYDIQSQNFNRYYQRQKRYGTSEISISSQKSTGSLNSRKILQPFEKYRASRIVQLE